MSARWWIAYLVLSSFIAWNHSFAVEWHVNAGGTGDAPTIQAAYDLASPGDVIVLAPGTYRDAHTREVLDWHLSTGTTSSVAFMSPGVSLVGSGGASVTTIDGEDQRHCLVGADLGSAEIHGVTFLDGRVNGSGELVQKGGAGVLVFRSVLTVEDCVFRSCLAPEFDSDGATGLYLVGGVQGRVRRNLFVDNYGGDIGGAMGILEHSGAIVESNTFVRNEAGDAGGAIEINSSLVTLLNNIFAFNSAGNSGGAVLCLHSTVLTGGCNLFWQNDAPVDDHVSPGCLALDENDNIVSDPMFCDPDADLFTIDLKSPAAPSDPSGCGLRGAYPVGCGTVALEPSSWGRIKGQYFSD